MYSNLFDRGTSLAPFSRADALADVRALADAEQRNENKVYSVVSFELYRCVIILFCKKTCCPRPKRSMPGFPHNEKIVHIISHHFPTLPAVSSSLE
jgi:hypothetical protein